MFEHEQRFYRNENDEIMVTVKVYDEINRVHGETKILKYNEPDMKKHFEGLKEKYSNMVINWKRVKNDLDYFFNKEKWGY